VAERLPGGGHETGAHHLRPQPDKSLLRDHNDQFAYALVDYELLERTPEHEQAVRSANRQLYLKHMARRFDTNAANPMPAHLRATNVLGVDYIFGRAESTGGLLWVVGKDPDLFNYFLPERWRRTPKKKLSARNQIFHTRTKDNINLVWKVSRMGDSPWLKNPEAHKEAARAYGFNSPFEEFAFAFEMSRHGVRTVYPRAIYMTGRRAAPPAGVRRTALRRAGGFPHARRRAGRAQGIRLHHHLGFLERPGRTARGAGRKILPGRQRQTRLHQQADFQTNMEELTQMVTRRQAHCGFEDLNLKPDHLLISFDSEQHLVLDTMGKPEVRLCNFELIRRRP
jgi:hypothetical protein